MLRNANLTIPAISGADPCIGSYSPGPYIYKISIKIISISDILTHK